GTFGPAYGVMSKVSLVHVCELELLLKMLASVCPAVLRTCASCQSNVQPLPEQRSSAVDGRYQNVNVVLPVGGMATVCERLLSPAGCGVGCTTPSRAAPLPPWTCALVAVGVVAPSVAHDVRPFSKSPLSTCNALDDGVTALDCADS